MSRDLSKGFLADICANPEDDTPRLVFADWLEENGQPERAELIRVQIERTRHPKWDVKQVRLKAREQILLAAHGKAWLAELPKVEGVTWTGFRRGFVGEASFKSWKVLGGDWQSVAPVEVASVRWPKKTDSAERIEGLRELRITGRLVSMADAERLGLSPLLSTLRVLDLKGTALGTEGLRRVTASDHLGRLEALRIADNGIGNGVAEALGEKLASLEELDLSESGDAGYYGEDVFTAEGMRALGEWAGMVSIQRLNLSGHDFRELQAVALLESARAAALKELTLRNTHNYAGWGATLADAHPDLKLDGLDIWENLFRREDAQYLAWNLRLQNLKSLHAYGVLNPDDSDDLIALASGSFMSTLRILRLEGGEANEEGIRPLLETATPHLHTLSLQDNYLSDEHLIDLAQKPSCENLHELDLRGNRIGLGAVKALGESSHLGSLVVLRVGSSETKKSTLDALAASPLGKRLLLLDRSER